MSLEGKSPWLNAWHDPLANIKTSSSCVRLADINGDGDVKLCVCDFDKKLKIYKGTSIMMELALLDTPIALCVTYIELTTPRVPLLAVAAGSHIFFYRSFRPYRKWTCPTVDIPRVEVDIWSKLCTDEITMSAALKLLSNARENGIILSGRCSELLAYTDDDARMQYFNDTKDVQYTQQTLITCMETIKKSNEEYDSISLIIVGTEAKQILVLSQEPMNSEYICKVTLPSQPVLMTVSGVFDVEWRVTVTCRDGKLYHIKNGDKIGSAVISGNITDIGSQAVALTRYEQLIWVCSMDKIISSYSIKGKKMKSIVLQDDATEICTISMKKSKTEAFLLVGLSSGEVRLYRESQVIDKFTVDGPIMAMRFGNYGREENAIVIIHGGGGSSSSGNAGANITIKIWRRTVDINTIVSESANVPHEQDIPLQIPKKTKLYVEQTQRERDNAADMHRAFQRDLCRLRLEAAKAYVKTLTNAPQMGIATIGSKQANIQVKVIGLGPRFIIKVTLQNSGNQPIYDALLSFSYDQSIYAMGYNRFSNQCMQLPLLLPGPKHEVEAGVLCIDPQGRSGQVLIVMYQNDCDNTTPILSASVKMPVSEAEI